MFTSISLAIFLLVSAAARRIWGSGASRLWTVPPLALLSLIPTALYPSLDSLLVSLSLFLMWILIVLPAQGQYHDIGTSAEESDGKIWTRWLYAPVRNFTGSMAQADYVTLAGKGTLCVFPLLILFYVGVIGLTQVAILTFAIPFTWAFGYVIGARFTKNGSTLPLSEWVSGAILGFWMWYLAF